MREAKFDKNINANKIPPFSYLTLTEDYLILAKVYFQT